MTGFAGTRGLAPRVANTLVNFKVCIAIQQPLSVVCGIGGKGALTSVFSLALGNLEPCCKIQVCIVCLAACEPVSSEDPSPIETQSLHLWVGWCPWQVFGRYQAAPKATCPITS